MYSIEEENHEVRCQDCNWTGFETELEMNNIDGSTYCPECNSFDVVDIDE